MTAQRTTWLPAATLRHQLQGLATLGLDLQRLQAAVGPVPEGLHAQVPQQAYLALWREALAQSGDAALPTALAQVIPFGAFGALDYLVGSAATLAGCVESARLHFAMVASDVWLECHALDEGASVVQVRGRPEVPEVALEFTLALIVARLRHLSGGRFVPSRVSLPAAQPARDPLRARAYGAALRYGQPGAELWLSAADAACACSRADPMLHATLRQLAEQLRLNPSAEAAFETAVRMRLRGALAQGRADAARIAALLGLSERTLQRRLAEAGRSFTQIVEDFRREEAARLLADARVPLAEVAGRLGYAEQTSFTRAFRRWHGTTPGARRVALGER